MRGGGSYANQGTTVLTTRGDTYGNTLLLPLTGGSGGGGGRGAIPIGGAGGGGAICIASDTLIDCLSTTQGAPQIIATGGTGHGNFGAASGGAIRLVAPLVRGTANLNVAPGSSTAAGYGRARIDTTSPGQLAVGSGGANLSATYTTFGSNMVVFPPNPPLLRIVEAAGQAIAKGRTDPVFVLLPTGAAETQEVKVEVENFGTDVPLRAIVSPESGERGTFDFSIDNTGGGVTQGSVNVTIPAGTTVRIDVWTR